MGQKICKQPKKEGIEKGNLKKPFVDSNELHMSQLQWISENQRSFDKRRLQVVHKALNIFCDKNLRYVKTNKLPFQTIGTPMSS